MAESEINPMHRRAAGETYRPAPRASAAHLEGTLTRLVEKQTAKIPSSVFLAAALGAMAVSATLEVLGQTRWSRFVGMWPSPLLTMGVYNKIVKSSGAA